MDGAPVVTERATLTPQEGTMRTGPRKTRDVLQRRLEFLEERISEGRNLGDDLSFDRAECAALRSAIHMVERAMIPAEGTALVIREGNDGGAQILLVVDGEEVAEVRAVVTPQLRMQVVVEKGDVGIRYEDHERAADVG
jgi:hypothetical protein